MSQELQRQSEQADSAGQPLALSAHKAMRSRHWRFWLGLFHVLAGLIAGYLAVTNTVWVSERIQDWQRVGQRPPGGPLAGLIFIVVGFSLVSVAGVLVGIWNLMTMKGTNPRPLRSAAVVSLVSFMLMMTFVGGLLNDPGKIGLPILHAVVAAWTIGILRLKRVPTPAAVAR